MGLREPWLLVAYALLISANHPVHHVITRPPRLFYPCPSHNGLLLQDGFVDYKLNVCLSLLFYYFESREFRPSSPMQKARNFILGHRESLSVYATDGELPIDNNPAERAIRRVAVGRKNWLFLGSEAGGGTAAVIMTLLGTCWANRVNAFAWLADVIRRMPTHPGDQLDQLLPHQWIEANPEYRLPTI